MLGESKLKLKDAEIIFKLQAFSSMIFNDYVKKRTQRDNKLLDGDILTRTVKGKNHF
jgi:tRNA(Glu) U13 pseudouridine synthase TruD